MMIAVQMDKKEKFDRLWKFSKTHMQHTIDNRRGYFRWVVNTDGSNKDQNTAPDGEIYFVTALYFASVRFGDGTGIYNYRAEADYILEQIMNKGWPHNNIIGSVTNMFNPDKKVCYVPYGSSSEFTDPSYFLPGFYEVWAIMANTNNDYWRDAATVARDYLQTAAHPVTGLMPDYANYDGTPRNQGEKMHFVVDAWRCIMNVAMDYNWFKKDSRQKDLSMRIQSFFHGEGMYTYWSGYQLDGTPLPGKNHQSVGLVACNAVGSLASDDAIAWEFIHALWNRAPTTGRYRYYDGMLQMMSLLHVAGEFKVYVDGAPTKLNHSNLSSKLSIYPNPSNGSFTIDIADFETIKKLSITDISGKQMFQKNNAISRTTDISSLKKGMYLVTIATDTNIYTEKILVR
jgi:endo-1,4-beta-D-glucanase Y